MDEPAPAPPEHHPPPGDGPPAPLPPPVSLNTEHRTPNTPNETPNTKHESPPAPRVLASVGAAFVGIFLFVRVVLVEPFGVPTGSMAPTLIGNHREAACPRCGYPVRVGLPQAGERAGHFADVPCPNCGKRVTLADTRDVNGDRLLVDKNVYALRRPRRWEVAVFRCAADHLKPYVKRVVGLPGEEIRITDGDVYAGGELLRKSLAEVRETAVPVYDLAFAPNPGGWGPRWLAYPADLDARLPRGDGPRPVPTADDGVLRDGGLVLDASASPQLEVRLEYRHWNLDEGREEVIRSGISYDGPGRGSGNTYAAHDFSVRCELEVGAAGKDSSFACRLFDGADAVAADLPVGPRATAGPASLSHDRLGGLSAAGGVALEPGRTYALEFALVDRRATLALDGRVVVPPADLDPQPKRGDVRRPLQLGVRGCKVTVRNLKLYRDIHYTQSGRNGTRAPARLGPDEFFVLGDNSGNSQDSREWDAPGVPEADFIGKPFFIHQPLRLGRVTVGGRERVVQTLDWSRLRWLH